MKFILPYKGFYSGFYQVPFLSLKTGTPTFISERDGNQNDFRTPRWLLTVFVFQNFNHVINEV